MAGYELSTGHSLRLHQGDQGLNSVLQIAGASRHGGAKRPKKSRMARRVALVSRTRADASPLLADSLARARNVSPRSTHLCRPHPSPPRRSPRAPQQRGDRSGEGEAVPRHALGWHPLRHRDADVAAQQSRRRQQHSEVHRHPPQGLLHQRDQRPQVRPPDASAP